MEIHLPKRHGFSSSGDSTVKVSAGQAVQYFRHVHVYTAVRQIAIELSTSSPINVLFSDGTRYTYRPLAFHSRYLAHSDAECSLTWERIHCLNQLEVPVRIHVIRTHFVKFLWDILKGIFAMFACGLRHGDPSLDNIGMRQGRFVLFDYNLSRKVNTLTYDDLQRDLYYFVRSIRWNLSQYDPDTPLNNVERILLDTIPHLRNLEEYVEIFLEYHALPDYSATLQYLDTLPLTYEPPTDSEDDDHETEC